LAIAARGVERAVALSRRPVSLAFLDLVGVNGVNRHHGEEAGTDLLAAVLGRLEDATTDFERVWRIGGDEYLLLLPNRGRRSAMSRLRRLHWTVAGGSDPGDSGPVLRRLFRAGGATTGPATPTSWDLYLAAAGALRIAKRHDRLIVWHWSGTPALGDPSMG